MDRTAGGRIVRHKCTGRQRQRVLARSPGVTSSAKQPGAPLGQPRKAGMGFQETAHTADCALRVWAPDLESLFIEAALGMNEISGAEIHGGARVLRQAFLHADDKEGLLVAFLGELLYLQENERLVCDGFGLELLPNDLHAVLEAGRLKSLDKSLKAVTFHNLSILRTARGYETELVFDV